MISTIRILGWTSLAISLASCTAMPRAADRNSTPQAEQVAMQVFPGYAEAVAAEAEAAKAPHDPDGLIKSMIQVTDTDRMGVKTGWVPSGVLTYDAQLLQMLSQAPATLEEHQRDPVWAKRRHALLAAKNELIQAYTAAVAKKNQQQAQANRNFANSLGNGHPDESMSPMGQKPRSRGMCRGAPVNGYETWGECPPGVQGD